MDLALQPAGSTGPEESVMPSGFGELAQLGEEVLPFADPQVVDELLLAQPAERGGGEPFCCSCRYLNRFRNPEKSDFSSSNLRCSSVALARWPVSSEGRSRGSRMVNAAARTMTSWRSPRSPASTIIRPRRTSTGSWLSLRPPA